MREWPEVYIKKLKELHYKYPYQNTLISKELSKYGVRKSPHAVRAQIKKMGWRDVYPSELNEIDLDAVPPDEPSGDTKVNHIDPQDHLDTELKEREEKRGIKAYKRGHDLLVSEVERLKLELEFFKSLKDVTSYDMPVEAESALSYSTAMSIWSDWHVEEEVKPKTVNNLNAFNLDIARKRVEHLANRVVKFIRMYRRDTEVKELAIFLGGDFITGNIHEENMENCLLRPLEAVIFAEELIASAIEFVHAHADIKIVVFCVPGNHSRITKKIRYATEQGNSLEYYMYHHLAKHFQSEPNVEFVISDSSLFYLKLFGMNIRMFHGQQIRYVGGVGGILIPTRKKIAEWDKAIPADLNLLCHWHQEQKFGKVIVNGSLIGYNAFALANGFEYEPPKQQFFLINGQHQRVSIYSPVFLP